MSENIKYKSEIIMDTLKCEVINRLGDITWDNLVDGIGIPDIDNESKSQCNTMYQLMKRFDHLVDKESAKIMLTRVRHGLKHSQFESSKQKFKECGENIDAFMKRIYYEDVEAFTKHRDTGSNFYGQPITSEVFDFIFKEGIVKENQKVGKEIHIKAFPFDMVNYLKETDTQKKRYYACHCPFARESILSQNRQVSKTLCQCSLGHSKVMWEAVLGRELDGEVTESVLGGDLRCSFKIILPDEIMEKYVKEERGR